MQDPREREARFVRFLKSIDTARTDSLYLLGDIFDFWYEYRDVVPKGYCRVFAALQDMSLGHGDGLGPVPRGYLFLRGIFHNRVLQFLFSMLHPWLAFRFGKGWSRNNRLARHEKYVFRGKDEPLYRFAEEFSSSRHVDCFIFGHYHVHVDLMLPTGARLLVLDDWLDGSGYIYFDGISGSVGYCQNNEK